MSNSRQNPRVAFQGARGAFSEEAAVKRAMVKAANLVVVVADSSKVGREHLISFAPLDSIDVLITDEEISPTDTSEFHDHGIEVVIA